MQRRKFVTNTATVAFGIGIFGKISLSQERYIGDNPTTTDILGPFYRPGAPWRKNINPAGYAGKIFHIRGRVLREDGKTPFPNCRIEIWQCDENRVYDNTSEEYRYRGTQKTGEDGKYHFIGMHPIPYPATKDEKIWRPAHIHLLVTGQGQQDLITQIYLEGDPYLEKDLASLSPQAIKRILKITRNAQDEETIVFDIIMAKEFKPDENVFEKITGVYTMSDESLIEFYRKEDLLMMKWNGQIREGLSYKGNNTFGGGLEQRTTAHFQPQANGELKLSLHFKSISMGEMDLEGLKTFKYKA